MSEFHHHIVDCATGEETLVPLTREEIIERGKAHAEHGEPFPNAIDFVEEIRALKAEIEALKAKGR